MTMWTLSLRAIKVQAYYWDERCGSFLACEEMAGPQQVCGSHLMEGCRKTVQFLFFGDAYVHCLPHLADAVDGPVERRVLTLQLLTTSKHYLW